MDLKKMPLLISTNIGHSLGYFLPIVVTMVTFNIVCLGTLMKKPYLLRVNEFNKNDNVEKIEYDLSNIDGIKDLVSKIDLVDILANNAGIMNCIKYDNYFQENIAKLMNVNLYAPIEFIIQVSKSMIKAGTGKIVNTASIAGQIGHLNIWYGASKSGIINVTKSFAKLLGSKGIVINALSPFEYEL